MLFRSISKKGIVGNLLFSVTYYFKKLSISGNFLILEGSIFMNLLVGILLSIEGPCGDISAKELNVEGSKAKV